MANKVLDGFTEHVGRLQWNIQVCCVYGILHEVTERVYIGSTKHLYVRSSQHVSALKLGKHHNKELQQVYDKDPVISLFYKQFDTAEEAMEFEQLLLDSYVDSGLLFNVSKNVKAPSLGLKHSEEIKEAMRIRQSTRVVSEATREKMRIRMLGNKRNRYK
jgi:predicted GIY-YIG superfamily endonuclease